MIIEPTQETKNGVTFNVLTYIEDYFACGYEAESKQIVLMSPDENKPQPAGSKTMGLLSGFGTNSFPELLQEIESRGLILPSE